MDRRFVEYKKNDVGFCNKWATITGMTTNYNTLKYDNLKKVEKSHR